MTNKHGGARAGSGPVRCRFTLNMPTAIYIREVTRSRLQKKYVSDQELHETLDLMIRFYAEHEQVKEAETPS